MSVGPTIIYEFANARLRIYMVAGPVGLAFIKLSVKIFSSDKKVTDDDIYKLKKYVSHEFGDEIGIATEKFLKQNSEINESIYDLCRSMVEMQYADRIGIVSQLFAMAYSDGVLSDPEELVLQKIAHHLHIGKKRYHIIKSQYHIKYRFSDAFSKDQSSNSYYQTEEKSNQFLNRFFNPAYNPYLILGLENSATVDDIKKAYRELVKKYHPDVLTNKSEQTKRLAKDKFHEINQAYETLKMIRGIK